MTALVNPTSTIRPRILPFSMQWSATTIPISS